MKKIIPFLFSLLIFGCSNEKGNETAEGENSLPKSDTLTIGKKTYLTRDLKDTNYVFTGTTMPGDSDDLQVMAFSDLVSRNKDSLFLKCDNGKTIKLVNNRVDGDQKTFRFMELNKDIDHYLICCSYVEAMNYLLVNKKTGAPMETIGPPVVSPDKNFFACGNCDLVAAFDINGIEIYKKKKSSYESMGLRELTNWGPEQMVWKNDTTLIIRANQLTADRASLAIIYKILFIN